MQPWLKTDGCIISKIINLFKSLLKPTICPVRWAPELRQLHFREEGEILANTCYIYCVTSWNEVRPTTQNGLPRVELQTNSCRHLVDTNNSWNKCVESQEMKQEIQTHTHAVKCSVYRSMSVTADSPDRGTNPVLSALWRCSGSVWSFALLLHSAGQNNGEHIY